LIIQGGAAYSWSPQSTLNNASIANPIATPANTTTYYVNVTGANGCVNSDSIKLSIRPNPVFSISPASDVCQNSSAQLTSGGGDVYLWQPSNTLSSASISNPVATPINNTTYTVRITDTVCGNSTSLSATITVLAPPVIIANKSNDIDCSIGYSQLSATGGLQYQWTPAATLSNSGIANPVATPVSPTQYLVKGINASGCSNFDSVLVEIKAINKGKFLMPGAFTPNNDGRNDCFGAKYWGFITDFNFSIFNRWGERVFNTKNPTQCWDGNYKGIPQKADVYVYIIKARSFCEESVFRKGTVALIR
jgi:gliding motility-associated-like protein